MRLSPSEGGEGDFFLRKKIRRWKQKGERVLQGRPGLHHGRGKGKNR